MSRDGANNPWDIYPSLWKNQAAFFTYLRGQLRLTWSRYPAKLAWKSSQLRPPPKGYIGRAKKLGTCHYCSRDFAASHLEVDHVQQAGQCNSWETSAQFLKNLLDCDSNWVLACKPCHKIKSYSEAHGVDFEEARIAKEVITLMKPENKNKMLAILFHNNYDCKNNEERKIALKKIVKKNKHIL